VGAAAAGTQENIVYSIYSIIMAAATAAGAGGNEPATAAAAAAAAAMPELCVFDLDMCAWSPEMFTLSSPPTTPVRGALGESGQEGIVGASNARQEVQLFPGALHAMQEVAAGKYPGMRLAVASSADTPLAVRCAKASLKMLEVLPGLTVHELLGRGWPAGTEGHMQIGRSPPLSANKTTHFTILHEHTGVAFDKMLFFDDCSAQHCFFQLVP
jgi:magnesium-dependent phosphatase 1